MKYFDNFPPVTELKQGHQLGQEPYIQTGCIIKDSSLGEWTALGAGTWLVESTFGDYSYTAGNVQIIYSEIGKYCSIANSVRINPGNHPQWRVTQHHMTYRRSHYALGEDDKDFFQWRRDHKCTIGHDVWIGHGAVIMPGVNIGTGAIIGSGAVVTKDVAPYTLVGGVPAKLIRNRFDPEIALQLAQIAWWDWPLAKIIENLSDFQTADIKHFCLRHAR